MRVSSRVDYGVRALFDLAQRFGQGPVQSRDIANRQQIPEAYLHQVLGALGRAGLVRSTRGPLGGHELAREPKTLTLFDVVNALEGPDRRQQHPHDAVMDGDTVHDVWHDLQAQTTAYLQGVTLETLVERDHARRPPENYSI
jgi:Rrf2 family cysteine metabolism transcriptional repressor